MKQKLMTFKEALEFFQCSESYLYKNYIKLGGKKVIGKIYFPRGKELYDSIFNKSEWQNNRLSVRIQPARRKASRQYIQDKRRSSRRNDSSIELDDRARDKNRHKLL